MQQNGDVTDAGSDGQRCPGPDLDHGPAPIEAGMKLAKNATLDEREAMRKAECIRAAAVDSFNWIDSNEVIRRGPRTTCTIQTAKAGDDLKGAWGSLMHPNFFSLMHPDFFSLMHPDIFNFL